VACFAKAKGISTGTMMAGRDAPRKGPLLPPPNRYLTAAVSGGRIGKAQLRSTRRGSCEKAARCLSPGANRSIARAVPARARGERDQPPTYRPASTPSGNGQTSCSAEELSVSLSDRHYVPPGTRAERRPCSIGLPEKGSNT
jgi:hypothetical protein